MIKSEDFEYYVSWFVTLLSSYVCYVCFFLFLIDENLYGPSNLFLRISNPANRDLFFQEPANSVMEHIIDFHHDIFFFLIVIVVFVVYMLLRIVFLFGGISVFKPYIDDTVRSGDSFSLGISNINEADEFKKTYFSDKVTKEIHLNNENVYKPNYLNFHHNTVLEIIWTVIPAIILLFIAVPSFILLYTINEVPAKSNVVLKVIGRQWYWSYEYNLNSFVEVDFELIDQYMDSDATLGNTLLAAEPIILLPKDTVIQLLVTSSDVIHSWAVPSFGVKIDACPGRLNQIFFTVDRKGIFYGQCSEICGVNHGFMPITILVCDYDQ